MDEQTIVKSYTYSRITLKTTNKWTLL